MSAQRRSGLLLSVATVLVASCALHTRAEAHSHQQLAKPATTEPGGSPQELDPADWQPILLPTSSTLDVPAPKAVRSKETQIELSELRAALQSATPHQQALAKKWASANQGRLWRTQLEAFNVINIAGPPSTLRLYAALQIAIADAEVAARNRQRAYGRAPPAKLDSHIHPLVAYSSPFAYPSDLAAETGAAERILLFARPEAAGQIKVLADESIQALETSGLYLKSDCETGRELGHAVAEEVLSVLERDGRPTQLVFAKERPWEQPAALETIRLGARFELVSSTYSDSVKWTAPQLRQGVTYGDLPPWNQALPVDPTAGDWQPLILASADQFHAPPPPENSSPQTMRDMKEIVTALDNRTSYTDFIVFKWANEQPGHWIAEIMDDLMDQYGWDAPKRARAEAILYAAMDFVRRYV